MLQMKDVGTGYSATALLTSCDVDDAVRAIMTIDLYSALAQLSADPEFNNESISAMCGDHNVY